MLSSSPELVQPVPQGGLDRESWTTAFSRQRIDTDWHIAVRFCNVPHVCYLMASWCESSKIRVPFSGCAVVSWGAKQFEAWQDDINGERWRRGQFFRLFRGFDVTVILLAACISCFPRVAWLSRNSSHVIEIILWFGISSCSRIPGSCCRSSVAGLFLFRLIRSFPAFSR
jgi:hypothetical protein